VNTVVVQKGQQQRLVGANTDVYGLVEAIREGMGERAPGSCVVLGSGATAASTLAALTQLGCSRITVFTRSMTRAGVAIRAAGRLGVDPRFTRMGPGLLDAALSADLVVSTLPPRAGDGLAREMADRGTALGRGVLLDCAYDPRPTALGEAWCAAGGAVVGGERMLLHQAAEQVRLMTGMVAPVSAMSDALEAALAAAPATTADTLIRARRATPQTQARHLSPGR
jgi:shikimate dehydrogenase